MLGDLLPQWIHIAPSSPSYVVTTIAFIFRCLAYATLSPFALITLLDITAYVIGRTLQAPKDKHRPGTGPHVKFQIPEITHDPPTHTDPRLSPTSSYLGRAAQPGEPSFAFVNFPAQEALSGVGLFSPPLTRAGTPTAASERGSFITSSSSFSMLGDMKETRVGDSPAGTRSRALSSAAASEGSAEGYDADVSASTDVLRMRLPRGVIPEEGDT